MSEKVSERSYYYRYYRKAFVEVVLLTVLLGCTFYSQSRSTTRVAVRATLPGESDGVRFKGSDLLNIDVNGPEMRQHYRLYSPIICFYCVAKNVYVD